VIAVYNVDFKTSFVNARYCLSRQVKRTGESDEYLIVFCMKLAVALVSGRLDAVLGVQHG
jgi:hypothetical protein